MLICLRCLNSKDIQMKNSHRDTTQLPKCANTTIKHHSVYVSISIELILSDERLINLPPYVYCVEQVTFLVNLQAGPITIAHLL